MILFQILLMTLMPLAGISPHSPAAISPIDRSKGDLVDSYRKVLDLDVPQTRLLERIVQLAEARLAAGQDLAASNMERAITAILSPRQRELFRQYRNQNTESHAQ